LRVKGPWYVDGVLGYSVRRNGRPVTGLGLGTPTDAEAAQHSIGVRLGQSPWVRGVSVQTLGGSDAILIQVQRPEHVPIARLIVGDQVNTVPVHYEAVGDVEAQAGVGAQQAKGGLGDQPTLVPPAPTTHPEPSPWKYALITTIVGAVTGWALDEIARRTFKKKRGVR
jgi:hypothetical protein